MKQALLLLSLLMLGMWGNAQTITLPHTESFEQFPLCNGTCGTTCNLVNGWTNGAGAYADWTVDINGTSSTPTGPSSDHTLGTPTGHYLYTEASSPCFPSRTFYLVTPLLDFSGANAPQVSFWYHQYGTSMGTLHIDASTDGGTTWSLDIVPAWTDNQDKWQQQTVSLAAYANDSIHLRIRGISGSSYESDMAVDDFHFYDLLPRDAGIARIDSPATPACNLGSSLYASLHNFGTDTLTSCTLNISVNGSSIAPYFWQGNLPAGQTDSLIFIGTTTMAPGDDLCIWTSFPNGFAENASGSGNDSACTQITPGLAGAYTIGGATPDFVSFTAAVAALNHRGVCGPVEFWVHDSTYQEQLVLGEIMGMSAAHTVTFRSLSGDRTACRLEWSSFTSAENYTLYLDAADHFIWKDINIAALGTTFARVLQLLNGSDHNSFENCWFQGTPGLTSTSPNAAIVYSPFTNDNYNTFIGNKIENGSYGIYWYGASTTSLEEGTVFLENELVNNYYYGSRLYNQDSPEFGYNSFTSNSTYTGALWRFYFAFCDNDLRIYYNRCASDQYGYGLYLGSCDGTSTRPGRIWNNFIQVGSNSSTNTAYGLYLTGSGYQEIVGNNFHVESNGTLSRGAYLTGGGGSHLINNNFHTTGPGYAIYLLSQYSLTSCNYNNLSAPTGTLGYFNVDQTTLADWQAATGFDTNSVSVDPMYHSPSDLHVCNDTLNGTGNLPTWLIQDVDGDLRSTSPDIGADEFVPILNFSLGPDTALCTGDTLWLVAGSPGDAIIWNTGDSAHTLPVTQPGTYSVNVQGACGMANDQLTVTQSQLAYTGFLIADSNEVCVGDTITLSSSHVANTYNWTGGSTAPILQVTTGGSYTLDLMDDCGSGSESIQLNFHAPPVANFSATHSLLTGIFTFTGSAAGNAQFLWDFGDGIGTSTLQDPLYVYPTPGTYGVRLIVTHACGADTLLDSITVELPNGLPTYSLTDAIQLYPNPNQGTCQLALHLATPQPVRYQVLNLQGQVLASDDWGVLSGKTERGLQLRHQSPGLYFLKIWIGPTSIVHKWIIQ